MLMKIFFPESKGVRVRDIHTRSVNHLNRTSYVVTSLMSNELNIAGVYIGFLMKTAYDII